MNAMDIQDAVATWFAQAMIPHRAVHVEEASCYDCWKVSVDLVSPRETRSVMFTRVFVAAAGSNGIFASLTAHAVLFRSAEGKLRRP